MKREGEVEKKEAKNRHQSSRALQVIQPWRKQREKNV